MNNVQYTVLPSVCVLCGDPGSQNLDLCNHCRQDLPWLTSACARCAEPISISNAVEALCGRCQTQPPSFERCMAMFSYQSPADHLLQALKFNGDLHMARILGNLMSNWITQLMDVKPEVLVPVPLHNRRLRERGFNQALELARPIARQLDLPMELHSCIRIKTTSPQSDLTRKERKKNVKNAFEVLKPVSGHIAIIGDVMTTGSTAHELASTLLEAGASNVDVWVCARA